MEQPAPVAEIIEVEAWSGDIRPGSPGLALRMKIENHAGVAVQPWLAVSPVLAARLIELLQTCPGLPASPSLPGSTQH